MAPEILMGDEFGLPADIFSLGVIFCEILSRKLVDSDTFKVRTTLHAFSYPKMLPQLMDKFSLRHLARYPILHYPH